jgi:hypothetical protein
MFATSVLFLLEKLLEKQAGTITRPLEELVTPFLFKNTAYAATAVCITFNINIAQTR